MITEDALTAYVDGEIEPDAVRQIEAALAADPGLRARLERIEERNRALRAAFDMLLTGPLPHGFVDTVRAARAPRHQSANLANAASAPRRPARFTQRVSARVGAAGRAMRAAPGWVGWAIAAQFAVLMIGGTMVQSPPQAEAYHALGAAPQAQDGNIMVIFKPDTSERNLRETLRAIDARIVNGPTPADAYLLHVAASGRVAALAHLRARADIVLAEPLDSGGPP
jgi:anti-sigma factor RsiW